MKTLTAATMTVALSLALGRLRLQQQDIEVKTSTSKSTSTSTTTANSVTTSATPVRAGPQTIADYFPRTNIKQTPVHHGDPGSPTIDLPMPPGWQVANESASAPYGGIALSQPRTPPIRPRSRRSWPSWTVSRPGQDHPVRPGRVAEPARSPGFRRRKESTLGFHPVSGFQGVADQWHIRQGRQGGRFVGQKTVVIPGQGASSCFSSTPTRSPPTRDRWSTP